MKKSTNRGPIFWNGAQKTAMAAAVHAILVKSPKGFIDAVDAMNISQDEVFITQPQMKRVINPSSINGIFKSKSIIDTFREHDVFYLNRKFWVCDFDGTPKDDLTKLMEHIDKRFEELQATLLEALRKQK